MSFSSAFGGIGRALSHPKYRILWATNASNTTGRWMYKTAIGVLTWELTESPALLGIVAFADTIPIVIMTIIAGAWTDRYGSIVIMRMCQSIMVAVGILVSVFAFTESLNVIFIIVLSLVIGTAEAVTIPARMVLMHHLVPKEDLSAAIALNTATFNFARFLGPALAGVLIQFYSIPVAIAASAAAFIVFYIGLLLLGAVGGTGGDKSDSNMIKDLVEGFKYVVDHKGISFLVFFLSITAVLIRPYIDLLAGVADVIFDKKGSGLSVLLSATGLGAMIGGFWLAYRGRTEGLTAIFTWSLLISAVALILFVLSSHIWVGVVFSFITGMFVVAGSITSQALIQNIVTAEVRGRVISITAVLAWGLPAIGALLMGWVAEFMGLAMTLALGAAITAVSWFWAHVRGKSLAAELEGRDPDEAQVSEVTLRTSR